MTEFDAVTERAAAFALTAAPSLVPALGVQRLDGALWLVSELDEGVWLGRLLWLSKPRPPQAVVIGLDVLHALQSVHAAGYAHGSVSPAEFRVGVDGKVRLDGWLAGALAAPAPPGERQRADLAAVSVLLADLAGQARSYLAVTNGGTHAMVAALDAAAEQATMPGARADLMAAPLKDACGADQEAAARSELAALATAVTALDRRPPSDDGSPEPPADPRAVAAGGLRAESRTGLRPGLSARPRTGLQTTGLQTGLRTAWRRLWTALAALVVIAGIVALEFAFLHERLMQDLHLLTGAAAKEQAADRPAGPPLGAIPVPAPATAAGVDRVDLRALDSCTPGTVCAVRVLVRLAPAPERQPQAPVPAEAEAMPQTMSAPQHQPQSQPQGQPQEVTWTFRAIDRCTGAAHTLPGGSLSVAPGGVEAQAVNKVLVPAGHAVALIAVTNDPAKAASSPLLVPSDQNSC